MSCRLKSGIALTSLDRRTDEFPASTPTVAKPTDRHTTNTVAHVHTLTPSLFLTMDLWTQDTAFDELPRRVF